MREIAVFLAPALYEANSHLVESLSRNAIKVHSFDVRQESYGDAVEEHQDLLAQETGKELSSPRLCLAFEDSRQGVIAASKAGMSVIGIAQNKIELERFKAWGAHAVALTISDILDSFGVRNYYQIQYLPYSIFLHRLAELKTGYPVSMLDTLSGNIFKSDTVDDDEEENINSSLSEGFTEVELGGSVEIDPAGPRIIPREVLGIKPGSLADVYINNIGWPQDNISTFHLDSRELERDIIRMFGKLYSVPEKDITGYVTSGGTEGNFSGLWWQRGYLKFESGGERPIILTSNMTHYSVFKAANQLDIEVRLVKTNGAGELDCHDLANILDEISRAQPERPVLMQVNFGTTQTGALDDLPSIHKLLTQKVEQRGGKFSIHVDAALMGAVVPVIQPFGPAINLFERFQVNSLAISGHKFFGSVAIVGVCLTTQKFLDQCFSREKNSVNYIAGLHDMTPSGSRSGFNVLSFHNTICGLYMHTNARRLREIVAQCYRNVDYFIEGISKLIGSDQIIHPKNSLSVCFTPRPDDRNMEKYSLMPVTMPEMADVPYASVCILVNVTVKQMDRFLYDYSKDLAEMGYTSKAARQFLAQH